MKGYKRHDFYIRVKKAGEPSMEKLTGGYITVRAGVTYACERQPVESEDGALRWNVWHVLTGLRVNRVPLRTSQDVEDFLTKLDHQQIIKAALRMFKGLQKTNRLAFDEAYGPGMKTLGTGPALVEFNSYGSESDL